ncbi:MAG: hypothetical protein ACYDBB_05880 [Armatimonadota bacterium]
MMDIPPPPHERPAISLPPEYLQPSYTLRRCWFPLAGLQMDIQGPDGHPVFRCCQQSFTLGYAFTLSSLIDKDRQLLLKEQSHISTRRRFRLIDKTGGRVLGYIRRVKWYWDEMILWEITDPDEVVIATCREVVYAAAIFRHFVGTRGLPQTFHFLSTYEEVLSAADLRHRSLCIIMPQGGITHIVDPRLILATAALVLFGIS